MEIMFNIKSVWVLCFSLKSTKKLLSLRVPFYLQFCELFSGISL